MDYVDETKKFLDNYDCDYKSQKFFALNLLFVHLKKNGFKGKDYSLEIVEAIVDSILSDKQRAVYKKILVRYIDEACGAAFSSEVKIFSKKKEEKKESVRKEEIKSLDDLKPEDIPDKKFDEEFIRRMGIELDDE